MHKAILLLFGALLGLSGCGRDLPPVPEPDSRPAKLFRVSVGNTQFERSFPATSDAGDKAVLAFRVPGQLQTIDVLAGQPVEKGALLATLNPDEYTLLEQQAKANFKLADVQYQRMKKLRVDKVVSEQDFDQSKANHNSAKALLEQAQANLRYTRLIAPYKGTISIIPAKTNEFIDAKQGVMNIQTNEVLKVVFQISDKLLNRFANGNQVSVTMVFDAFPERSFPLMFQEVDTEADSTTGSYKVTMVMDRPKDIGILPGMSGSVTAIAARGNATRIPQDAIFEEQGETCVWRVSDEGIVEKVQVTLNEKRQVLSGLTDGDQIVTSGVSQIEAGIKVREWIKERGL